MNIRQQLVLFSEIGILDGEIRILKEKEKSLPAKANVAKAKAQELAVRLAALEKKHGDALLRRRQLDLDLQNERNNLRKWESRADQIRGDREYAALMSEIGSLKRTISNLETQIIEDMQLLEDTEKEIGQVKSRVQVSQAEADEELSQVSAELAEVAQEITTRQNARTKILASLPTVMTKRYEAIFAKRASAGVAVVKKEVCQGCMRTIPPELFNRVSKAEVIEQCPYCNRIMVTEELSVVRLEQ
jgi:predicted  nucleic acid-binding Zn-ribbon protein